MALLRDFGERGVETRRRLVVAGLFPGRPPAAPRVESDCEESYCGTCETAVVAGEPEHHDVLLSKEERAAGRTMMPCVSRALGPRLVLDL